MSKWAKIKPSGANDYLNVLRLKHTKSPKARHIKLDLCSNREHQKLHVDVLSMYNMAGRYFLDSSTHFIWDGIN
ncbi:hypothetical protein FRX31_002842 [Thalictrum thalictroides]|uniref:Uncharacterized protein n=1 Tax=Thalictrum thalictroides TaxID=46969 RepID=A0A7J6XG99_THATH|nr:hypothetical protein FRX31_002842 [Thalictrum thalictroides]